MKLEIQSEAELYRRLSVGFIVCIWILAPYLLLQKFAMFDVWWIEESSIDKKIDINFNAVYVYFSYYFLLAWTGLWISSSAFTRYMKTICVVCLISHFCFFFVPSGISRDSLDSSDAPYLYQWLISWELPRNCFPSLHASLATLASLALIEKSKPLGLIASLWTLAILWSAVALRQHVIIDLLAGSILAIAVWYSYLLLKPHSKNVSDL